MSDKARLWSRRLRGGFIIAEHAIARELAEHHNEDTNLCFPNMGTLCETFEMSRTHIKRGMFRLECWGLITRVEWFEEADSENPGRQTSNRYRLNLNRHFPDPPPEGRTTKNKNPKAVVRPYDLRDKLALAGSQQGKRLLKLIHQFCSSDQTLVSGIKEAFLQKNKDGTFKLWVAVESLTHETKFKERRADLKLHLQKQSGFTFEIDLLQLFYKNFKEHRRIR